MASTYEWCSSRSDSFPNIVQHLYMPSCPACTEFRPEMPSVYWWHAAISADEWPAGHYPSCGGWSLRLWLDGWNRTETKSIKDGGPLARSGVGCQLPTVDSVSLTSTSIVKRLSVILDRSSLSMEAQVTNTAKLEFFHLCQDRQLAPYLPH